MADTRSTRFEQYKKSNRYLIQPYKAAVLLSFYLVALNKNIRYVIKVLRKIKSKKR